MLKHGLAHEKIYFQLCSRFMLIWVDADGLMKVFQICWFVRLCSRQFGSPCRGRLGVNRIVANSHAVYIEGIVAGNKLIQYIVNHFVRITLQRVAIAAGARLSSKGETPAFVDGQIA
jgi:hypothetical protein